MQLPNLPDDTKRLLGWLIVAIAMVGASFLGVNYPIPAPPGPETAVVPEGTVELGLTHFSGLGIADTDYAETGAQTLTPSNSYYQLNPSATLTLTLGTGDAEDGDILILHNVNASNSVVVVDTTATQGGANVTVGTDDLALFIFGNSKWVEIASPDNS